MQKVKTALYFFIAMVILIGGGYLLDLPTDEEIRGLFTEAFTTYGPIVIFLGSLIEGLIILGFYFPGSLIIFLSVALAGSPLAAAKAVFFVTLGLYTAYIADYVLGKYGWYRLLTKFGFGESISRSKEKLEERGWRYVLLTFWAPGFASLTSTAAGILRTSFPRYALTALIALVLWNTFWGVVVYMLGEAALSLVGFKVVIGGAIAWLLFELVRAFLTHRKKTEEE